MNCGFGVLGSVPIVRIPVESTRSHPVIDAGQNECKILLIKRIKSTFDSSKLFCRSGTFRLHNLLDDLKDVCQTILVCDGFAVRHALFRLFLRENLQLAIEKLLSGILATHLVQDGFDVVMRQVPVLRHDKLLPTDSRLGPLPSR